MLNVFSLRFIHILLLVSLLYLHYTAQLPSWITPWLAAHQAAAIQEFNTIFLSILIEALPLVMVGVLLSSLIHTFIPATMLTRFIPRGRLWGILTACLLGLVLPMCECAIIPVARQLVLKGLPPYIAVSYMLSAPIISPIVAFSTYLAFSSYPSIVVYRLAGALICTIMIALLLSLHHEPNPARPQTRPTCSCCHSGCSHSHHPVTLLQRSMQMLNHASDEFFDIARFLLIGTFLAALIQINVARSMILNFGQDSITSVIGMMSFAFFISLCSHADAFVAAPFINEVSTGAIVAFLVFGPMIDLKNSIMLFSCFKPWFSARLILLVTVVTLTLGIFINCYPQIRAVMLHV